MATAVTLTGANTATPSFTAPTGPATLTFELTVTDNDGATDTDTVVVTSTSTARTRRRRQTPAMTRRWPREQA